MNGKDRLMKFDIEGVLIKSFEKLTDHRGWLMELFRNDRLADDLHPVMSYLSMTQPGIVRGPHEHKKQTDIFCFLGFSHFRIYLWDNRPDSPTFSKNLRLDIDENHPCMLIIPPGVVHAYKNVGDKDGLILNAPNKLYSGEWGNGEVDEIRYEDDPDSRFKID